MSFVKRSEAAPVCHSKPLDSFAEMDLFAFICHPDPTKVRIGERELAKKEGIVAKLFDEADDAEQKHSVGRDHVLDETIAKDVSKKLRDDYHSATSITGRKSLATIRSLVPEGSSVPSGIAEPQDDGLVDSVSGINLRTCPPSKRYVISSDDSYHLDSRSEVSKDKVRSGTLETFGDSASDGEANVNAASSSKLNEPTTLSDSFYASQDLDSETLHNIYMCLGAKVRMRAEHTLKQKDRLEDKCAKQTSHLSAKDVEISHLRSLLSLKETEAVEAIHLCSQLSIVKAADAAKSNEPKDNAVLGETSLSFSLQVVHSWVQRVRGEIQEKRLSLTNVMVPFAEPLSSKSLIGEAITSATPVTTEPITTLSTTFMSFGVVPPLSISNDQVLDTEPNDADPPAVTFEKEELATSLD
uniref:Uncharacterized protein n=1 Tax=Tanacetum cinerariifolium TaxID=118510 RepID=A0A699HMH8_TANCI|nr:hypothetical protein [Tanacetum cinerariifolium]